jgi:hypothetical protein
MSNPSLDRSDLLTRPFKGLALIGTVVALGAFAARAPEVIQAHRVELVSANGVRQASLAADTSGVMLTLFDSRGRPAATLRLNDDPRLSVLDAAGREAAGLWAPRVQHLAR